MTLKFIGLGLHDGRGISMRGIEEARKCDVVYAEFYTTPMPELDVEWIQGVIGRKIKVLKREDVEEGKCIIRDAMERDVALLVGGDPMAATTHLSLRIEAMKRGIKTVVVHSESIFTAAASAAGLQHYKFGRTITIPWVRDNYFPMSPYDMLARNRAEGKHTLVLLDTEPKDGQIMRACDAVEILLMMEEAGRKGVFSKDTRIFALARVGSTEPFVIFGRAERIMEASMPEPPHTIIVPGEMHFMEEEFANLVAID
ncbi:MAG: diphthine synthase [Thermoplasmata archaeon]|nr:MAG: diphthine synthase [Thermoplasmata archaeon]